MNRSKLKKDPNQDRIPINDFERAADLMQWVFYLDWFAGNAGRLIHARSFVQSLADMRQACCNKDAQPAEVQLAWQMFYDVAGPFLTGQFIVSGAWRYFCPDPRSKRDTASQFVIWEGGGKSVVARVQFYKDEPNDISFVLE